jgi:hypothetical protein
MHDTLEYLVTSTINRPDANKFLYILNQIDVTAKEDNPEEVVSAWQRSLSQAGLLAGRFYRIYDKDAAITIDDPQVRERFERKRDEDFADIIARMHQIETERSYRIAAMLEQTADAIENQVISKLETALARWKSRVLLFDSVIFGVVLLLIGAGLTLSDNWHMLQDSITGIADAEVSAVLGIALVVGFASFIHFSVRGKIARSLLNKFPTEFGHDHTACKQFSQAFRKSTAGYRPMFLRKKPVGWNGTNQKILAQVKEDANDYIQTLNDQFTDPSGHQEFDYQEPNQQTTPAT